MNIVIKLSLRSYVTCVTFFLPLILYIKTLSSYYFQGYNGERRSGFGGGRGRNAGSRGGGFRDGGRRDYNGNRGGGDYNQQNNSGGYGGGGANNNDDGEEQKKPREFYIPPEPTDNEDEIFGSGITSGINFSKYDSIPVKVMTFCYTTYIRTAFGEDNYRKTLIFQNFLNFLFTFAIPGMKVLKQIGVEIY